MESVHYGGFWIRVGAAFIDYVAIFAALFPVRVLFGSVVTALGTSVELPIQKVLLARRVIRMAIGMMLVFAYRTAMESSTFQATLGKMALRLQVTDLGGNRISFTRAVGRHFAKYLSLLSLGLGYLMVGFDEEKQGLHDRVAGTLVVYRQRVP